MQKSNNGGWIKLHRKLSENPIWLSEPFTRGQAWVDLIMLANHKESFIRVRGVKMPIKRGQVGWSELKISVRWKWSRGKVRRFLNELETVQQIVQQKNNVTSLISIINYEGYQSNDTTSSTPNSTPNSTTDGHQTVQQTDTNKKDKKDKKDKNIVSDTSVSSPSSCETGKPAAASVPYSKIYERYAKLCPSLRQVRMRSNKRDAGAKRVWSRARKFVNGSDRDPWEFVEMLFSEAEASAFLRGELSSGQHANWKADFEFVCRDDQIVKILEGGHSS